MNEEILNFINTFKNVFPKEVEFTFYRGQCYWFSHILATRFKGDIWFNAELVHFACFIDNALYDIYGKIEDMRNWTNWHDFQCMYPDLVDDIVDSCIKKIK